MYAGVDSSKPMSYVTDLERFPLCQPFDAFCCCCCCLQRRLVEAAALLLGASPKPIHDTHKQTRLVLASQHLSEVKAHSQQHCWAVEQFMTGTLNKLLPALGAWNRDCMSRGDHTGPRRQQHQPTLLLWLLFLPLPLGFHAAVQPPQPRPHCGALTVVVAAAAAWGPFESSWQA